MTDTAPLLHRRKGTVFAYKEYLRYVDCKVLKVERPGQRVFSGPGLSKAERERWLIGLPQVRVWLHREGTASTTLKSFGGSPRRGAFGAVSFFLPSTALARMHRRARYVVNDAETDTRVSEFGSYFRLHIRSTTGLRSFSGRPAAGQFFMPSSAWRRLVTIQPASRLPWRGAVGPSLTAVASEPDRVKVAGVLSLRVIAGRPGFGQFFLPSTAHQRIFDRYAVHDGSRQLRPPGRFFVGVDHFGWPPHTLRLTVSIPGKKQPWMAGDGIVLPHSRFFVPSDSRRRVERARRAVQAAARETDVVLLRIGPRLRFVAGRPFIAGVDRYIVH